MNEPARAALPASTLMTRPPSGQGPSVHAADARAASQVSLRAGFIGTEKVFARRRLCVRTQAEPSRSTCEARSSLPSAMPPSRLAFWAQSVSRSPARVKGRGPRFEKSAYSELTNAFGCQL